jgi:hypothetical protein
MTGSRRRRGPHKHTGAVERGVPDCTTGPTGRLRFVADELAQLWRHHRRASSAAQPVRSER